MMVARFSKGRPHGARRVSTRETRRALSLRADSAAVEALQLIDGDAVYKTTLSLRWLCVDGGGTVFEMAAAICTTATTAVVLD
ncbi:hypothetical protein M6B38_222575 [Iris pallida]|uniref:Uncharacterized protein n=1 Tax=Iris pallida TaxID=29817 RepID=A0AAX6DX05_IRIPA|nr:hypothetical protein M6B38_222575 [Iris pallida]